MRTWYLDKECMHGLYLKDAKEKIIKDAFLFNSSQKNCVVRVFNVKYDIGIRSQRRRSRVW